MKILIGCTLIVIGSVRIIKTIKDIRNDKEGIFINVNDVKQVLALPRAFTFAREMHIPL